MTNFTYRIEERHHRDGSAFLTIIFDDPANANLSYFLMDDSHRLTITDGRVDAIREVTNGDVDSWDSGGNATYWSVNRDVTIIRNHFDDEPELDPAPPVRVPTSTLENLILAWRAAADNFSRRHQ